MGTRATRGFRRSTAVGIALLMLATAALVAPTVAFAVDPPPPLAPIDPQVVTQAAQQDWDDYHPIPTGPNYADNGIPASIEKWNVGLLLNDFPDTPFTVTQPTGSNVFGNPGPLGSNIPRANVPSFYVDWLNTASAANNYQTMNRYWMEDSFGRYGVNLVGYGPYQLFGDQGEYFIDDISGSNNSTCNVQTRSINSAQTNVTSIEVVSSASFSVGKILMNVAPDVGGGGTLSATRTVTAIPDATHLETGNATTFSTTTVAGVTTFRVGNSTGILAGHTLNIGWDDRLEAATVAAVGDGTGATTLGLPTLVGDTVIKVPSITNFTVGEIILIEGGVNDELATILTVGTAGASTVRTATAAGAAVIPVVSSTGFAAGQTITIDSGGDLETRTVLSTTGGGTPSITVTAALTNAHPVGAQVSGSGLTLTSPLTLAHAAAGNVTATWVSVDAPLTYGHANNTIVRDMNTTAIASVAANTYLHTCNRNFRTDAAVAWADHVSQAERDALDNFFVVSAGQDESGTWQEFGEMQFTQNTVSDAFGPPNPEITQNWAATRYIPWTSWRSAATVWPSASGNSSTEGEGSGMAVYAHELTHNLGLPDNYNNPYAAPFQRAATGYWSMMSRGSFGGPGGTHNRWRIPSTLGTALGSQHVLRDKIALGFVPNANFTDLDRTDLATSGLAVVDIQAREADPGATNQLGLRINLDGGDATVACTVMSVPRVLQVATSIGETNIKVDSITNFVANADVVVGDRGNDELVRVASVGTPGAGGTGVTLATPLTKAHAVNEIVSNRLICSGTAGFNNFLLEVNQQIGSDSFQPTTGVLIEKNKTSTNSSCGSFTCFAWVVDAHPTDINMLDFMRPAPDGTPQWVTTGDPRQLTDATFHAGTNSGSLYEWEDTRNNLRFYILERTEVGGVVHYKVAVQNLTGQGPHARGVSLVGDPMTLGSSNYGYCNFDLTNTGLFASFTSGHPETDDVNALVSNDVYRLSTSVTGTGWTAELPNALANAAFGATVDVPVYITRAEGADEYATIQLTATSVSDGTKTATASCSLDQVPPVTTADLQPPAVGGYFNNPTVTLTPTDGAGSGILSTEYNLDSAGFVAYTAPFQVTGDGPHTLLYRSTDNAGNIETDNSLNFNVDATAPVITISDPDDGASYEYGQTVNADYECTDATSGVATCVGPVADGTPIDTLTLGAHSFQVDASDVAGNSTFLLYGYTVTTAATTTDVVSDDDSSVFGQNVTFTATVAPSGPGTGLPTGTIQFTLDSVNAGSPVPLNGVGQAQWSTSSLSVAGHTIGAEYSGDTNFNASSDTVSQTVSKADTTTSITNGDDLGTATVVGQSYTVEWSVVVNAPGAGTPTGTVEVTGGSGCSAPVADGECDVTSTASGSKNLVATYSGDGNFNGSASNNGPHNVNLADTSVGITNPTNPSVHGQSVTFTATVTVDAPGAGTPTGTIQWSIDSNPSGSPVALNGSAQATLTTAALSTAGHTISAVYSGDPNFNGSTSDAFTQTVNKAESSVALSSNHNPSVHGQSVTFTAAVTADSPGVGTPTGVVQFSIDGNPVGSPVVVNGSGQATFVTSTMTTAAHTVTAAYGGDADFNSSGSNTVNQTVNRAGTSTSVVRNTHPSVHGQPVTFTATVTTLAPGAGTPSGFVQFRDGSTNLGAPVALNGSGQATSAPVSNLSTGNHTIRAVYAQTANWNTSTSPAVTQTVNKAATTTNVTANPEPSRFGRSFTLNATVTTVAPGAGFPLKKVQFYVDGQKFRNPVKLVNGHASLVVNIALTMGNHTYQARFLGNKNFLTSNSSIKTHRINP